MGSHVSEHLASEKRKDSLKIFEAGNHRCKDRETRESNLVEPDQLLQLTLKSTGLGDIFLGEKG